MRSSLIICAAVILASTVTVGWTASSLTFGDGQATETTIGPGAGETAFAAFHDSP